MSIYQYLLDLSVHPRIMAEGRCLNKQFKELLSASVILPLHPKFFKHELS